MDSSSREARRTFSVSELRLWKDNPRFLEPVPDENSAIAALLRDGGSKLLNLASDIAQRNSLNPADLPIVLMIDGVPTVLEGNRRIAALKLLRNPEFAPFPDQQEQFSAISKVGIGPELVLCSVAQSLDEARPWIELRHTGENNGVGILPWSSFQIQNFAGTKNTHSRRAAIFLMGVAELYVDDRSIEANTSTIISTRLTNLGRLVSDPQVRKILCFEFSETGLRVAADLGKWHPLVRTLLDEVANILVVGDLYSREQRAAYADGLLARFPLSRESYRAPEENRGEESETDKESTQQGTEPKTSNVGSSDGSQSQPKPRKAEKSESRIFQGFRGPYLDSSIRSLLNESQKITIESCPTVCGAMIRVIVELTLDDAITELNISGVSPSSEMKAKLRKVIHRLDPLIQNKNSADPDLLKIWNNCLGDDAGVGIQLLHSYVHGMGVPAIPTTVRSLSKLFRPLLEKVDNAIMIDRS